MAEAFDEPVPTDCRPAAAGDGSQWTCAGRLLALCAIAAAASLGAQAGPIMDDASAIEAARHYLKARCTPETPCTFKPQHEGRQWRVWVRLIRRDSPNAAPHPYPGGTLILYFDAKGSLLRRLEGD